MNLENVDVLDMLQALQIRNIDDLGDEIQYSCPFPFHANGDDTPSAYMNTRTTAFYCHGCKAKGNAIHFLAKLEGISPLLAARFLRERYDSGFREPDGELLREFDDLWRADDSNLDQLPEPQEINYEMSPLPKGPFDYLIGRGFLPETLESWQISYDHFSDRIAIPVRNQDGGLIGFKGRSHRPDHKPKYLVLGDRENRSARYGFPTYEVSRVVFGLDKVIKSHPKNNTVIITEGELDVISLSQKGFSNSVSIGSNPSDYHRDSILGTCSDVVLFLDSDPAGAKAVSILIEMFEPYVPVRVVPEHEGDPASLTTEACEILIRQAVGTQEIWMPEI